MNQETHLSFVLAFRGRARPGHPSVRIMTGCGIMSSVWGMILQGGSTVKSEQYELPIATRHGRDMTENR